MALAEKHATENAGDVYGFGLVYSGNFFLSAQTGEFGTIRVCESIRWTFGIDCGKRKVSLRPKSS